jgi:hypothetical protein
MRIRMPRILTMFISDQLAILIRATCPNDQAGLAKTQVNMD